MTSRIRGGRNRQGVILLVVLTLLALFTIVVLTFVIVATQHRESVRAETRPAAYDEGYTQLLERGTMQVVSGSSNPLSAIGGHSLLEDEYGNDFVVAMIPSTALGSLYDGFTTTNIAGQGSMLYFDVPVLFNGQPFRPVAGFYNGRVITMINGAAAGQSARIVGYAVNTGTSVGRLLITPFRGMTANGVGTAWQTPGAPQPGDLFLINGRPFNGAGAGYNAGEPFNDANGNGLRDGGESYTDVNANGAYDAPTGLVDAKDPLGREYALLPFPPQGLDTNYPTIYPAYVQYRNGPDGLPGTPDDPTNYADEDYDAVDFQNMIIAGRIWNVAKNRWEVALPSLFRPDLLNHWLYRYKIQFANTGNALFDLSQPQVVRELLSRLVPRPLCIGNNPALNPHPKFLGNPQWDLRDLSDNNGNQIPDSLERLTLDVDGDGFPDVLYDVDNDGDGRPDSIWVDLGVPVQTGKNGQLYKPLFAILVEDMDGKLNLNAHGNGHHYQVDNSVVPPVEYYVGRNNFLAANPFWAGGPYTPATLPYMPVGYGFSVADVNLAAAVVPGVPFANATPFRLLPWPSNPSPGVTINEYRFLQQGKGPTAVSPAIPGKWGEVHRLMSPGPSPLAGLTTTGAIAAPAGYGFDGAPGILNIDDDNNGTVDDPSELGAQGSDDLWDGDDNKPAVVMSRVAGSGVFQFQGSYHHDANFRYSPLGANGTPGDPDGKAALGLDLRGQPIYIWPNWVIGAPEGVDEAPEMDLSLDAARSTGNASAQTTGVDQPFTADELERLLRHADADRNSGSSRLQSLAPSLFIPSNVFARHLVTTHSFDLPSPAIIAPPELHNLMLSIGTPPTNLHVTDLLALKLIQGLSLTPPLTPAQVAAINAELAKMLSNDLVAGLRLDINRPLGNDRDDDGDGIIDDPDESIQTGPLPSGATGPIERLWMNPAAGLDGYVFDANDDGVFDANNLLARHYLARHLFVLAMLVSDAMGNQTDPGFAIQSTEFPNSTGTDWYNRRELTARRLAQWAINVVDFRDRDSIMTPFEYDVNPFNGWTVDGFVGVNPISGNTDDDVTTNNDRRLVWGCEYPDLLLMETSAGHDRRTEDLPVGGVVNTTMTDDDFDQQRIPEGWAFIELYCTRNPNNAALIGDLYRPNGMLDLGKMDPTGNRPVWRLAVTASRFAGAGGSVNNNVVAQVNARPDSTTLQPEDMSSLDFPAGQFFGGPPSGAAPKDVAIDRYVWFAAVQPGGAIPAAERDRTYYNYIGGGADVLLPPGRYAVVGPHRNPTTGPKNRTVIGTATAAPWAQEIDLGDTPAASGAGGRRPVVVNKNDGTKPYPEDPNTTATPGTFSIQEPLGIAVAGNPAGSLNPWAGGLIGFSISEPLFSSANYYPTPTITTNVTHFDGQNSTWTDKYSPVDTPFDNTRQLGIEGILTTQTVRNYKAVFLQRLANPAAPYDPVSNPYISVDWMPIDLTVYNGEYDTTGKTDPDDVNAGNANPAELRFSTRQRSMRRDPTTATPQDAFNIWKQPTWTDGTGAISPLTDPPDSNPTAGQTAPFRHNLRHTLGFINEFYADATVAGPTGYWTTGSLTGVGYPPNYAQAHAGDPAHPFPWLTWNNRPYASHIELLNVPASSPERLLYEYDYRTIASPNQYHFSDTGFPVPGQTNPYSHLLNFFWSSNPFSTPNAAPGSQPLPNLGGQSNYQRLLEYVRVPSRFSGTDELLNPNLYSVGNFAAGAGFDAPFNRISRYRDPGRVNINTIFDNGATLRGILNDYPGSDVPALWTEVVRSRRGYSAPGIYNTNIMAFNVNYMPAQPPTPTVFGNPFRSPNSVYNVPLDALKMRNCNPAGGTLRSFAETGLLRPDPQNTDVSNLPVPIRPLFCPDFPQEFMNTDRNAYFRYQAMQKLGNVLTTRSNVYAVWTTVGFFEAERVAVDAAHPDGYQLGAELGIDNGQVRRHRAFYLFDRTIPVGFQRGQNFNSEKAILLKRVIE